MRLDKHQAAHRIARVLRAARKWNGQYQNEVSTVLGCSQAHLSKLESGLANPSAVEWFNACSYFRIDSHHSFRTGYIDKCSKIDECVSENGLSFKIPKRYKLHQGSKIRTTIPLIEFVKSHLGENTLTQYFEHVKIDPDFFVIYDNQLNIQFNLDLISTLIEKGALNSKNVWRVTKPINTEIAHGKLHKHYSSLNSSKELLRILLENITKYETNFTYNIIDEIQNSITIAIEPTMQVKLFDYKNSTLGTYICEYKKQFIKQFCRYISHEPIEIIETECHFKRGNRRCLYKATIKR